MRTLPAALAAFTLAAALAAPARAGQKEDALGRARADVRAQRYEQAISGAKRALSYDERYVPAMVVLARAYYHLKKYELAAAVLDIAKKNDANSGDVYNLLGFVLLARDDRTGATAAFQKATELAPDLAPAWNNLGSQFLVAKNYAQARDALERAVALRPQLAQAHLNLGSALRGLRDFAKAEQEYRKALELDRGNPDVFFNLGILFLDANPYPGLDTGPRLERAIAELARYKQAAGARLAKDDPVDGYIDEARKALERERKRLERQRQREAPKPAPAAGGAK